MKCITTSKGLAYKLYWQLPHREGLGIGTGVICKVIPVSQMTPVLTRQLIRLKGAYEGLKAGTHILVECTNGLGQRVQDIMVKESLKEKEND